MNERSKNGENGRDSRGRFLPGNPGGPGNPHARKVAALRASLLSAVNTTMLRRIVRALIAKAVNGDVVAAREVLDRVLGKPSETELRERIEAIEAQLAERDENNAKHSQ